MEFPIDDHDLIQVHDHNHEKNNVAIFDYLRDNQTLLTLKL